MQIGAVCLITQIISLELFYRFLTLPCSLPSRALDFYDGEAEAAAAIQAAGKKKKKEVIK